MESPPPLSVAVASAASKADLTRCLEALLPQARAAGAEVVVAGVVGPAQRERYGGIVFLPYPAGTPGPTLLGAALAQARGTLVAVTETRTVVGPGWVQAALAAPTTARPLVGGVVEPLPERDRVSWAAYFCDYAQFMRPLTPGDAGELPGNNVVFPRALLGRAWTYTRPAFWKTYWCRALVEEGIPLTADPSLVVFDRKAYALGPFLLRRFRHGRCFAGMRGARFGRGRRLAYAAGSPLLPVLFLCRILGRSLAKGRFRKELAASLPVIVLAVVSWSVGEGVGYVAGAGGSCRHVY